MQTRIQYNDDQINAINSAVNWYKNSSSNLWQMCGYAGTGKTTTIKGIIDALELKPKEILPMAYSGQAAIVMRQHGFKNACTCHAGLYEFQLIPKVRNGQVVMNQKFNIPELEYEKIPKKLSSDIKLIILDEASMIPMEFRRRIDETGIKVIATGDLGQLPPITGDSGYLVTGPVVQLNTIMRQEESSPIVYLATRARNNLPIDCGKYGDTYVITRDDLKDNAFSLAEMTLCYTKATRDAINKQVRLSHGITSYIPQFGEHIICRRNNWHIEADDISLVNGLIGTVVSHPDETRINTNDMVYTIDFAPRFGNTQFNNIDISLEYLKATQERKEQVIRSRFVKGEMFDFAYACTVHSSQGSEFNSGIYIEQYDAQQVNGVPSQPKLNYTAITRFKKNMLYVKDMVKYWVGHSFF